MRRENIGIGAPHRHHTMPATWGYDTPMSSKGIDRDRRRVFVLRGRDQAAYERLSGHLEAIGLEAVDYDWIRKRFGGASHHVFEVVQRGYDTTGAVIALFTPEDRALLRSELNGEGERERLQPRPNVIFEAGYALGLQGGNTVIALDPGAVPPSDLGGTHVVRLEASPECIRRELAIKLNQTLCRLPPRIIWKYQLPVQAVEGNLLNDWDFGEGQIESSWQRVVGPQHRGGGTIYGVPPSLDDSVFVRGPYSARLALPTSPSPDGATYVCELSQRVSLGGRLPTAIRAHAWSKAEGVQGRPDRDYSLWLDIVYEGDQRVGDSEVQPFTTGDHDWESREVTIVPRKPVNRARLYLFLRGRQHSGTAWFDCVSLVEDL